MEENVITVSAAKVI